jgi:cytochrome c-type biogenesis protein CcmH
MLRRVFFALCLVAVTLTAGGPAFAVKPDEVLADKGLEARARELSKDLRCMVCQNESIDESNAPLARDLRLLVRERLVAGDTNEQVKDFLVARYGDFVLLRPRFTMETALLWTAPFLILVLGAGGIVYALRRRRSALAIDPVPAGLSAAERKQLDELLKKG